MPITIYGQDWDQAAADGFVTIEHVLGRLQGMASHAIGPREGDVVGYGPDGFITVLIAEGLRMKDGVQVRINPDDHLPPHAHIVVPGGPAMKMTINLDTFEIDQDLPDGWSKRGKQIEKFTRDNQAQLLGWWAKNHTNGQSIT